MKYLGKVITKFADSVKDENGNQTHWYQTDKGEKIECNCFDIQYLWFHWSEKGSKKEYEDGFIVFYF